MEALHWGWGSRVPTGQVGEGGQGSWVIVLTLLLGSVTTGQCLLLSGPQLPPTLSARAGVG